MDPISAALSLGGAAVTGVSNLLGGASSNAANAAQAANANYIQANEFLNSAQIQQQEFADTQRYNANQAAVARNWSASQAQLQRDYQTSMSNTAYQRAVGDMKAAGLNPILSAGTGGASTPAGAMPSAGTSSASPGGFVGVPSAKTATFQNVLGPAVSSALQGAKAYTDISETYSRAALNTAQARLNTAQASNLETGGSTGSPVTTVLNPVKKVLENILPRDDTPPKQTLRQNLFGPGGALRPSGNISMPWDAQSDTAPANPSPSSTPQSSASGVLHSLGPEPAQAKSYPKNWLEMREPPDYPRSLLGGLHWTQ